jgi:2-polyprenyl-3-methyl-5-hydroxy-6-metoxy-1,4-benzoquinol methylase
LGNVDPHIERADGELRLVAGGSVQSVGVVPGVTPRGYWRAMLPGRRTGSTLVLGIGGGTIAHLLWERHPDLQIVGVDCDGATLDLAREHFGLATPRLQLVHADALDFALQCREQFDLVIVDLFVGEVLADVVQSRRFQRRIRGLVKPGGTAVWSLHRDRRSSTARRRVGAGMLLQRRVLAGLNLVLHLRRRRRRYGGPPEEF